MYSVQLNFCKVWYSLGWVRLWCLNPPYPPPDFCQWTPPIQNFFKISNFVYTSWIYQNYCSVMYIYRDIHDFMFPFFKLILLQNIFSHHASQLWKLKHICINHKVFIHKFLRPQRWVLVICVTLTMILKNIPQ